MHNNQPEPNRSNQPNRRPTSRRRPINPAQPELPFDQPPADPQHPAAAPPHPALVAWTDEIVGQRFLSVLVEHIHLPNLSKTEIVDDAFRYHLSIRDKQARGFARRGVLNRLHVWDRFYQPTEDWELVDWSVELGDDVGDLIWFSEYNNQFVVDVIDRWGNDIQALMPRIHGLLDDLCPRLDSNILGVRYLPLPVPHGAQVIRPYPTDVPDSIAPRLSSNGGR